MTDKNQRLKEIASQHFGQFVDKVKNADPAMYGIVAGAAFFAGVTGPALSAELAHQAVMEAQGLRDAYIASVPDSSMGVLWQSLQGKLASPTLQHASVAGVANLAAVVATTIGSHFLQRYGQMKGELEALREKALNAGIPVQSATKSITAETAAYNGPRGATPLDREQLLAKQMGRSENSLSAQLERGIQAIEQDGAFSTKKKTRPKLG